MLRCCIPECNFISLFKRNSKNKVLTSTVPINEIRNVIDPKAVDIRTEDPVVINDDSKKI